MKGNKKWLTLGVVLAVTAAESLVSLGLVKPVAGSLVRGLAELLLPVAM